MVNEEGNPIQAEEFNQNWPRMPEEIERGGKARRPAHFAHLYEYVGDIEAPLGVEWKAMNMAETPKISRTVAAGEFKAKCLAIIDEVVAGGGEVVVTKRGKRLVKLTPVDPPVKHGRPSLAHYVRFTGDVESPIDVEWDAMR